jgi:hypothetical protein
VQGTSPIDTFIHFDAASIRATQHNPAAVLTANGGPTQVSQTGMDFCDELGRPGLIKREDRHGVPRRTWLIPVRRMQKERWWWLAILRERGREEQLSCETVADRFVCWATMGARRAEQRRCSREWREAVSGERARKFVQRVQNSVYMGVCMIYII